MRFSVYILALFVALMSHTVLAQTVEERLDALESIVCPGEVTCISTETEIIIPPQIVSLEPGSSMLYGNAWSDAAKAVAPCGLEFETIMYAWNGWTRDSLRSVFVAVTMECTDLIYRQEKSSYMFLIRI
jgi:hypothetical protein